MKAYLDKQGKRFFIWVPSHMQYYILVIFLHRLKFTADGSGRAFFISSDMFYLEVIVEQGGSVCEVHIQHEGKSEPQTCNEIAVCLNSGNFSKFTSHLQVTFSFF